MITTNKNFWDCECEIAYIHPKTTCTCTKCGANKEDQPDSRADELEGARND